MNFSSENSLEWLFQPSAGAYICELRAKPLTFFAFSGFLHCTRVCAQISFYKAKSLFGNFAPNELTEAYENACLRQ
jgi:hypothetical protein